FQPEISFEVRHITDSEYVLNQTKSNAASENLFFAIKIYGKFENVHVRMMPKQEKPYTKLIESAKKQPEFHYDQIKDTINDYNEIECTIVGFYEPTLFHGIAAGGFHLHFVDRDKTIGGHVLDFEMNHGDVEISNIETLEQHFPVNNATFLEYDIDYSTVHEDIKQSE